MLTEAAIRTVDRIGTPERRRIAAADGVPFTDAARIDPRTSVAAVLVTYSVLMVVVVVVGVVLGAAGFLKSSAATKAELSAICFVGSGAVVQVVRVLVIYPALRGVRMGTWHPIRAWQSSLAYPRDTDFIPQAIAVLLFVLLWQP
jgi:hypothetical protein